MITPLLNLMIATTVTTLVILATMFLSSRSLMDREKASPFECGFDPKSSARLPFSMRFFMLAVIFLVFDVEIALLLPIPLAMKMKHLTGPMLSGAAFVLILIAGLLHEWNEGSLDWMT